MPASACSVSTPFCTVLPCLPAISLPEKPKVYPQCSCAKPPEKSCWPLSLLTLVIVNRRWRQLLLSFEYKTAELSATIASCSHQITVILMMDANRLGALWHERLWYVLMSVKTLCLFLDLIRQALLAFLFLMEQRL